MSFIRRSQVSHASTFARTSAVVGALALAGIAAAVGCTVTTSSAPVAGCNVNGTVACSGANGYSCSAGYSPSQSNGALVCNSGVSGLNGGVDYCCVAQATTQANTCAPNTTVQGCQAGSFGFTCTNPADSPNTAYPTFNCSSPTPGTNGGALYCCTSGGSTTPVTTTVTSCGADATIVGCQGGSTGYTCPSGSAPDPSALLCSTPTANASGTDQYCCSAAATGTSCRTDSTIVGCQAGSYGVTCTNPGDTPTSSYPNLSLNCSSPTTSATGAEQYCCSN